MKTDLEHLARRRARFWRDLGFSVFRHPVAMVGMMAGWRLPADFRERIMLAVSQVNGCRACSWMHTREALKAGVAREEIKHLLAGEFSDAPEAQRTAIFYAQHWADTQGEPDAEAQQTFEAVYPEKERKAILHTIRFINAMNHLVIGTEGIVRVVTFGKLGGRAA